MVGNNNCSKIQSLQTDFLNVRPEGIFYGFNGDIPHWPDSSEMSVTGEVRIQRGNISEKVETCHMHYT